MPTGLDYITIGLAAIAAGAVNAVAGGGTLISPGPDGARSTTPGDTPGDA